MPLINQTLDTVYQRFVSRVLRDVSLERLESFSFMYMSNGKREFVPLDQVFSWIVAYWLLLLHKNKSFHASFIQKNFLDSIYLLIFYFDKFSTWIWRLPLALNVTLKPQPDRSSAEARNHERWPKSETCACEVSGTQGKWSIIFDEIHLDMSSEFLWEAFKFFWCFQVGGGWICRVPVLWESSVEHVHFAHDSGS